MLRITMYRELEYFEVTMLWEKVVFVSDKIRNNRD